MVLGIILFRGLLSLWFCLDLGACLFVLGKSSNIEQEDLAMQNQEMTMDDALKALEALLNEFAFRSGGGDGEVVYNAIRALEYLSLQKQFLQEQSLQNPQDQKES